MNKEELIGKLQMVYVGDRNALNELIGYYDGLKECIEIVQQENKKYKEVIDKAVKYIKYWWNIRENQKMDFHIQSLLKILKEVEETYTNVGEVI